MSSTVAIRINEPGIAELGRTRLMPWLVQLGNRVMNNSAVRVPVDTGYLRSSRVLTPDEGSLSVRVSYRANYAIFVHNGTRYMTGRPYLTDALREEVSRL